MLTSFIDIIPVKINSLSICFINFVADLSHPKTKKNDITSCITTCYVVIR